MKPYLSMLPSLQIAQLALKHRQNKNGSQRLIVFVGSPLLPPSLTDPRPPAQPESDITASPIYKSMKDSLVKAGKQLRKVGISLSIICLGEEHSHNVPLLQFLVDAADATDPSNKTCHLISIPAGILPSDVLASSPLMNEGGGGGGGGAFVGGGGGGGAAAGAGGGGMMDGGIDPNMDPELAMAIRVSMEEHRSQLERQQREGSGGGGEGGAAAAAPPAAPAFDFNDDDEIMRQAIAMSMNDFPPETGASGAGGGEAAPPAAAFNFQGMDEDDADMQAALAMSMAESDVAAPAPAPAPAANSLQAAAMADPNFVNELMEGLEGADAEDERVKQALKDATGGGKGPEGGGDKK